MDGGGGGGGGGVRVIQNRGGEGLYMNRGGYTKQGRRGVIGGEGLGVHRTEQGLRGYTCMDGGDEGYTKRG